MASFCKVMMIGNLTRDPELKYTPNGAAVCEFGVAVNRTWNDKQTGQKKEEVSFIDCTAWGRTGEVVAQYMKKGSPIFVEGRLTQNRWEDQQSGQKRSKVFVTVENVQFLGGKKNGQEGGGQPAGGSRDDQPGDDIPF